MNIELKSTAFQEGAMIPKVYTCDGQNISPPLSWSGIPAQAKSIALIMDDPDSEQRAHGSIGCCSTFRRILKTSLRKHLSAPRWLMEQDMA